MLETLTCVFYGLLAIAAVGSILYSYIVWRGMRQMEDAAQDAADQQKSGGGGGPKPVK